MSFQVSRFLFASFSGNADAHTLAQLWPCQLADVMPVTKQGLYVLWEVPLRRPHHSDPQIGWLPASGVDFGKVQVLHNVPGRLHFAGLSMSSSHDNAGLMLGCITEPSAPGMALLIL